MCLMLETDAKLQIAEEDIICYKWVKINTNMLLPTLELHGKPFHGIIKNIEVDGVLSIVTIAATGVYLCHNIVSLNGLDCIHRFGYEFSWRLDGSVKSIIVDGKELLVKYMTPYRYYQIEIGETYYSKLIRVRNEINIGLHSFLSDTMARLDANDDGDAYDIIKCIIPKGSEYYEGHFRGVPSYASNCIKYVEIVKNNGKN